MLWAEVCSSNNNSRVVARLFLSGSYSEARESVLVHLTRAAVWYFCMPLISSCVH